MKILHALFLAVWMMVGWSPQLKAQTTIPARQLYDRVMEEFRNKDYDAASAGFRLFLELHGKSTLAGNAQFWIGESEYRLQHFRNALTAYEKVLLHYPKSQKTASATLKMALTYFRLSKREESRILFERIVLDFPGTSEAREAEKHLSSFAVTPEP